MSLVGWLPPGADDRRAAGLAAEVTVIPISRFSLEPLPRRGLVFGFASTDEVEIRRGVERLAAALAGLQSPRVSPRPGRQCSAGCAANPLPPRSSIAPSYSTRCGRVLIRAGYVRFRRWQVFAERALGGEPVAVWRDAERLTLLYQDEPLAQYRVVYQPDRRRLRMVTPEQLVETPHRSPQPPLWTCEGRVATGAVPASLCAAQVVPVWRGATSTLRPRGGRRLSRAGSVPTLRSATPTCKHVSSMSWRGVPVRWLPHDVDEPRRATDRVPVQPAARHSLACRVLLVCGDHPVFPAGVCHYSVHDHALRRLRAGDFRSSLVATTANETAIGQVPLIAVTTSTFSGETRGSTRLTFLGWRSSLPRAEPTRGTPI